MTKFNTHGGYFAPTGYFRVDTGGSHEENPNGGVQIGVDPEGTPNMLEEGEPVYNDYVYSDNITADKEILKKHNIPTSYAGKLYSVIADSFVDEAEERPLDNISNNGLNAMLVRLADAQEEQKQIQEQQELENELASMSPEELEELEQMLAQQEALEAQQAQLSPEEQMSVEQQMQVAPQEQAPMMQMPMMAYGGNVKRGNRNNTQFDLVDTSEKEGDREKFAKILQNSKGLANDLDSIPPFYKWGAGRVILDNAYKGEEQRRAVVNMLLQDSYAPMMANGGFIKRYDDGGSTDDPQKTAEAIAILLQKNKEKRLLEEEAAANREKFVRDSTSAASKYNWAKWRYEKTADRVNRLVENANNVSFDTDNYLGLLKRELEYQAARKKALDEAEENYSTFLSDPSEVVVSEDLEQNEVNNKSTAVPTKALNQIKFNLGDVYACGGKINRYPGGGWLDFLNSLGRYGVSLNPGGVSGRYRIDRNFPLNGYKTVKALEGDPWYQTFTNYVLENGKNDPSLIPYFEELDKGTYRDVPKLLKDGKLVQGWEDIYEQRRKDGLGGIYHFTPKKEEFQDYLLGLAQNDIVNGVEEDLNKDFARDLAALNGPTLLADYNNREVNDPYVEEPEVDAAINAYKKNNPGPWTAAHSSSRGITPLATFPRYAGAISSGILGLYNAFQEPDRYDLGYYNPVLPTGQMNLVDPVYNPLDQNMATQTLLASSAGTNRALQNSGLGPSTGAALLASDYNTGRNLGNTFTTVWDANNQRLNNVIAQRNQNGSLLGNFNYGINRDRANILNQAALHNLRNNYLQQRLNYEAEAQKYAAIQNQIDNVNKALAGIGLENTYLNQINFDDAYDYIAAMNGVSGFAPNGTRSAKCGGFIKKYKK